MHDLDPVAVHDEVHPHALHPPRMLRPPFGVSVDHEPVGGCASLAQDVDHVDADARREGAHERVHRILPRLRRSVESGDRAAGTSRVEAMLAVPRGAHGDRRLVAGVGNNGRVRMLGHAEDLDETATS